MSKANRYGSLTGSKRYQAEKGETAGAKAQKLAEQAGAIFSKSPEVINTATTAAAKVSGAVSDLSQLAQASSPSNYRTEALKHNADAYGGVAFPTPDFNSMVPSDLLNPQIALQATEEQLTAGLAVYAGAKRAQLLLQAGFKQIEEIGKTKQQYHKAEQSIIKAATEGVKVQQEIVRFDKQNVELDIDITRRDQASETLKQERIKLTGQQKETAQLMLKIEAHERKRDAEIQAIDTQTQSIIQKYLNNSINNT